MDNQQKIIETIAEILTLPSTDIDAETSLQDDLGLNRLEKADLLNELSKRFKILFDPMDTTNLKTVGELVDYIEDALLE